MKAAGKRILYIYGAIGLIMATTGILLHLFGLDSREAMPVFLVLAFILLVPAVFIDRFGFFCLLLAWLPFSRGMLEVELGIVTFNIYVIGVILLLFLRVIAVLLGRPAIKLGAVDVVIAATCMVFLASTLFSSDVVDAGFLAFHAVFIPIVSFYVVRCEIKTEEQYNMAILFLVAGIFVFSVLGIIYYATTGQRITIFDQAFIGVATIAVTGTLLVALTGYRKHFVAWIAIPCMFMATLLTLSRAYLVLLLFSPVVYYLVRRFSGVVVMSVFIGVTLFLTALLAQLSEPVGMSSVNKEEERTMQRVVSKKVWLQALNGRGVSYKEGFDSFQENPIIGDGLKSGEGGATRHNFHLEWLEYGGLVGYILYAMMFIMIFHRSSRKAREDQMLVALMTVSLVILANSLTNGLMHGVIPTVLFLMLGFMEARIAIREKA